MLEPCYVKVSNFTIPNKNKSWNALCCFTNHEVIKWESKGLWLDVYNVCPKDYIDSIKLTLILCDNVNYDIFIAYAGLGVTVGFPLRPMTSACPG